jgi:hypothetical protein
VNTTLSFTRFRSGFFTWRPFSFVNSFTVIVSKHMETHNQLGETSGIQIANPAKPTINLFALAEQQAFSDGVLSQRQMWVYTGRIAEIRHLSHVRSFKQPFWWIEKEAYQAMFIHREIMS